MYTSVHVWSKQYECDMCCTTNTHLLSTSKPRRSPLAPPARRSPCSSAPKEARRLATAPAKLQGRMDGECVRGAHASVFGYMHMHADTRMLKEASGNHAHCTVLHDIQPLHIASHTVIPYSHPVHTQLTGTLPRTWSPAGSTPARWTGWRGGCAQTAGWPCQRSRAAPG